MKAFHHHFFHNTGPAHFVPAYDEHITLDKNIQWEFRKKKSWKLSRDSVSLDCSNPILTHPDLHFALVFMMWKQYPDILLVKKGPVCWQEILMLFHLQLKQTRYSVVELPFTHPFEAPKYAFVAISNAVRS